MKHAVSLGITLFGLWLVLSGHLGALLLSLGVVSTAFVLYISLRMELIDHESHPVRLTPRLVPYWIFLGYEIIKANLDVAARILKPSLPVSPNMISVRPPQRTDLGLVIYANSITLTPGTVSVNVTAEEIQVHALTRDAAASLQAEHIARRVPEPIEDVQG